MNKNSKNNEFALIEAKELISKLETDHFYLGKDIGNYINSLSFHKINFWKDMMISDYTYDIVNFSDLNKKDIERSLQVNNQNIEEIFSYIISHINYHKDIKKCFIAGIIATLFYKKQKISWFGVELLLDFDTKDINLINTLYYFTFAFSNHLPDQFTFVFPDNSNTIIRSKENISKNITYQRLKYFIKTVEIDIESLGLI